MARNRIFAVPPVLLLVAVLGGAHTGQPQSSDYDNGVAAVRGVLEAQTAAWNRGDVAGYMEGYARDSSTTFVSGDVITRGWQTVLDRYTARYDSRAKMGTLSFTELEFRPLSDVYIMAIGRWQLTREGDAPHGRFTLLFHRTGPGWRIVHDHTSSAP